MVSGELNLIFEQISPLSSFFYFPFLQEFDLKTTLKEFHKFYQPTSAITPPSIKARLIDLIDTGIICIQELTVRNTGNDGHNILELFSVLALVRLATNKTELDI